MKRLLGLFMLILVVLATGCKDKKEIPNIIPGPGEGDKATFTVGVPDVLNYDDARSRITFQNESLGFTWDENDKIVVLGFKGSTYIGQQEFTLTDGKGTTLGTFEGTLLKGASNYTVYYKSKNLSLNEKDGTATLSYKGQQQNKAASTAHLRDYLLLSANQLTNKDFATGAVRLSLQNSIMRFDVKAMQHDIGTIKSIEWINAFNTPDTHSMTLTLAPEAVSEGTLTTFLCFHPDSMTVAPGVTSGALFNAYNTYIVTAAVTNGKTFAPGYCYHSTIQVEPADGALTDWKRVQTPDEIWVKTLPQAEGNVAPTYKFSGFQEPVPVTGTDYWSYKSKDGSDVHTIPYGFFKEAVELTAIRLPKKITTIGDKAFEGCTSLEYFYYSPASEATLGKDLFKDVPTPQTKLVVGQRLLDQVVGKQWLDYKWKETKGVDDYDNELPVKPAEIQLWVRTSGDVTPPAIPGFKTPTAKDTETGYWKYITNEEITAVPDNLFGTVEGKEVIQEIFIPEGYTHIGHHAFEGCSGLTQLVLPSTLTHIGNAAVKGCSKLGAITLPANTTVIGSHAFEGCTALLTVQLPAALKTIGEKAFYRCSSLASFSGKFASEDGKYLIDDRTIIAVAPAKLTTLTTPKQVRKIASHVFDGCDKLTKVTFSADLAEVGDSAFLTCNALDSLDVQTDVHLKLHKDCFDAVHTPDVVLLLDVKWQQAPANRPEGNQWYGYTWKETIYTNLPPVIRTEPDENEIWVKTEGAEVTPRARAGINEKPGDISGFKPAVKVYGQDFWSYQTLDGTPVKTLENNLFQNKTELIDIYLPCCVLTIENNVFEGCSQLQQITIQEGVQTIGNSTFKGCSDLKEIYVPEGVESIGDHAFQGCTSLTEVVIKEGVKDIGESAFEGCKELTDVELPSSLGKIDSNIFEGCDKMEEIKVPGTKIIEEEAFKGLTSLKKIVIDDGVESIGKHAFLNCTGLQEVVVPHSVLKIAENAFEGCTALEQLVIKTPYREEINEASFVQMPHGNILLYLNKDWLTNPYSTGVDRPKNSFWQTYHWKAIGDTETGDIGLGDIGDIKPGL